MKPFFRNIILGLVISCALPACNSPKKTSDELPIKEGDVSYISFLWAPNATMIADSGVTEGASTTLYSYIVNNSKPHLQLYSNWARISYYVPNEAKARVVCVPLSSIFAFNWKNNTAERADPAKP